MPTNLPPDYFEIEKRFRQAETVEEKIEALQEMISVVPKHKGTDHLARRPASQAGQTKGRSPEPQGGEQAMIRSSASPKPALGRL